jgi:single-strand DNA-binding protein
MKGVNKVILVGHLANPKLNTKNNYNYFTASIAINSDKLNKETGFREKETTWINLVVFNKLAETASEFLAKGDLVYIEGKLTISEYVDKNGSNCKSTSVVVTRFQKLSSKRESEERKQTEGKDDFLF